MPEHGPDKRWKAGDKLDKKQERAAWRLYAEVRDLRKAGASYQEINEHVARRSGGTFPGQATLENALEIPSAGDSASGMIRSGIKGATLSFSDELGGVAAGVGSLFDKDESFGDAYTAEVTRSRAMQEEFERVHPRLSLASEVAGGLLLPGAAGARVMAQGGKTLSTGARVVGAAGRGALTGAAAGAAEGAGRAEGGLRERGEGAAIGGAVGGVAGGILGGALTAAEDPLRKLGGSLLGVQAPGRMARETLAEIEDATGRKIGEGAVPGRILAESEPTQMGQALRESADASRKAQALIDERVAPVLNARGEDLAAKFRKEMGIDRTYFESMEAAHEGIQKVREQYYKPLERVVELKDAPDLVAAIVEDPVALRKLPADIQEMIGRMGDEGINFQAGQELVEAIEDTMAGGNLGSQSFTRMRAFKRRVQQEMEEVFPGYREANRQYYNAVQRLDAHEIGQKAWGKSPEEVRKIMAELPTQEARDAYRLGALDKAEVALYELEGGGSMANKMAKAGQGFKDRIEALFDGKTDEAVAFLTEMERSGRLKLLNAAVYGGPDTARRLTRASIAREPISRSGLVRSIVSAFWDDPKAQQEAAVIVADILTTQGEEAAMKAAAIMARGGRGARAVTGLLATEAGQQSGGLLSEDQ